MATHATVDRQAADRKHGMTLDELAAFVAEAKAAGAAGHTVVKMSSTWRQSIQSLSVQVEVDCGG
jgi:uncharacterized protein YbbC (DUF1343 family)